jgi:hypothetical protein
VRSHAALPDREDLERIGQVVRQRAVENDMTEAAADDGADHAVKEQVVDVARAHLAPRLTRPQFPEYQECRETEQVHQAVPADRQRAQLDCDRAQVMDVVHAAIPMSSWTRLPYYACFAFLAALPSMAYNNRSKNVTQGVARSANRAMYYAMGYKDEDFDKPMVGVANGHSTITPCNSGLQKLADAAIEAITGCNANPQVFGTPTISDGIGMGTEGMKYSLVSREVIADCIETCVNGQWMDGVIVIGGCDKNMPGGMMAIARCNVPAIYVYGGTVKPGRYKDKDLTIVSAFEAVGEFTAGRLNETDFKEIERRCIPGSGSCGGMYTANTMSSSFEALGMSLLYSSTQANPDQEKVDSTAASACVLVDAIKNNLRPSDIITRKSIENAVALIMAVGGSTNAVLHYPGDRAFRRHRMDDRRLRAGAAQGAGAV